jgi:flagellar protein FlgJ
MNLTTVGPALGAPPADERLRDVARQLEGVFVEQLFKAMRETVPDDGVLGPESRAGESMFTGLLDQQLAAMAPGQWQSSLAASIVRQLGGRAAPESSR